MATTEQLTQAVERFKRATPAMRQPFLRSAVEVAKTVADERDALVTLLEARWRWCDAHKGHAAFVEREDAVLIDLVTYQGMEDALRDAAGALFGEAA